MPCHRLQAGDRHHLSAVYSEREPSFVPPLGEEAQRRIGLTLDWWSAWSARCTYEGPHRDAVVRSALVLKLLAYAPSGAIIAAPTTSLPQWRGGTRNWDYRFCWLRDASLTLRALFDLGYDIAAAGCTEARARVAQQSFRFALIDVHLPDGDGRHLGAALTECGGLEQVVLMTGRHGVAAVPTRHGISALLTKPVDIGKIHRLFTAVLGSARPAAAG